MPDLRTLRKQLGAALGRRVTQAELASAIGIARQTLCEHERGKTPVPRERILAVMCLIEKPELIEELRK